MFSKNENNIQLNLHNKLIAERTGLNPYYLQRLDDNNYRIYFHICRLQEYLANFRKGIYPSLQFRDLVEAFAQNKIQELLNLHTGYLLIKYRKCTITQVRQWTEEYRQYEENRGCMVESVAISGALDNDVSHRYFEIRR